MQRKLPIVVIAGQGNAISPSKLPHVYNVLDWFHVTDVWAEKSGPKKVINWRVRLEKIKIIEKSWWAVKGSPASPQESTAGSQKADVGTCTDCGTSSKVKYNAGWACLEPGCDSFFKFKNEHNDTTLDYDDKYMKERTSYGGLDPGSLSPPLPTDQDASDMEAYGFEKALKRGIVCPKCNCCSRRIVWDHWYCENSDCDFTYTLKQRPISPDDVIVKAMEYFETNKRPTSKQSMLGEMDKEFAIGGVLRTHKIHGPWNINEYAIPDEAGKIIGFVRHFKSNGIINQQKDGPNDLFEQMQTGGFALRRSPARQAGAVGEILTSHFAANFGAPYKFSVKQVSRGFDQAPEVIFKTIKRLSWAGQVAVGNEHKPFQSFNECLAIGYFEGSVINYHDDGEKTLGPTVATLSLGAPARMMFRPKAKSAIGKLVAKARTTKPPVLQITLSHGDIVVMDGEKIQKLYEVSHAAYQDWNISSVLTVKQHAVTPWGFRYALTCRQIIGEKMDTEEERQAAFLEGTLPPGSDKYNYTGDLGATEVVQPTSEVDKINNEIAARMMTGSLTASQISLLKDKLEGLLACNHTGSQQTIMDLSRDIAMPDTH
ncbi:hypothetical protein D0Z07_3006 [Hyphodiscus hymeniophilus]|uniref:Fe2OG dioxygenase domain-containing protein n=1 Tax=Hyphodiscus hymeniophilus TaxID=353542 RepID=A0A9P7AY50_9HELO|nr:hypothetical protein D0Z07_3006 [Hyphodiscus hymeniophilus]